ncbi:hypothetical protein SAMN06265222_101210 [Neorhodopirellula lusitana]|uniref:Uncharacterized protein n=1 Tax=Neorhodopirellula lusitana TaxID=445327 RepID=A0ABY1PN82_9BACT|nr:hypothetical protein SAMN06265222_101210 [Neorhodopirellula lusitana]
MLKMATALTQLLENVSSLSSGTPMICDPHPTSALHLNTKMNASLDLDSCPVLQAEQHMAINRIVRMYDREKSLIKVSFPLENIDP